MWDLHSITDNQSTCYHSDYVMKIRQINEAKIINQEGKMMKTNNKLDK